MTSSVSPHSPMYWWTCFTLYRLPPSVRWTINLSSSSSSAFSLLGVGASSFQSPILQSLDLSFGLPIFRCPPTSMFSLLHILQSFSPHGLIISVLLFILSHLCLLHLLDGQLSDSLMKTVMKIMSPLNHVHHSTMAIQVLCDTMGGRLWISTDQRYESVQSNIISVTRICGEGSKFQYKNRYVALEWPPSN